MVINVLPNLCELATADIGGVIRGPQPLLSELYLSLEPIVAFEDTVLLNRQIGVKW